MSHVVREHIYHFNHVDPDEPVTHASRLTPGELLLFYPEDSDDPQLAIFLGVEDEKYIRVLTGAQDFRD